MLCALNRQHAYDLTHAHVLVKTMQDSMQPKGGQKHDMLRGKALTDVLGHVSGHYEGGGQDRPTNDLLHKPLWLPDNLSAPPLLPMRQSQKDDATWGASFDLHNIAQPPQVLSERSSLRGMPTDAMSYIGPAAPVACLPLPAADPSQVTSSHSADGRPNSQQVKLSAFFCQNIPALICSPRQKQRQLPLNSTRGQSHEAPLNSGWPRLLLETFMQIEFPSDSVQSL